MVSQIKVDSVLESSSGNGVTVDGVLIKDGNVDGVDVSGITQGITEADYFINSTNLTASANPITTWAKPTAGLLLATSTPKGTGMSVSSGVFTFPSTGKYIVKFTAMVRFSGYAGGYCYIYTTNDNGSTWDNIASMEGQGQHNYDTANIHIETILDIQDTSNDKVKFRFFDEGNATLVGSNDYVPTAVFFYKLGET
jgi:hypothetical protein